MGGNMFWYSLVLFLVIFANDVMGDQRKESKLEDIVVTATKTEKIIEEVPGRIEVITQDEIKQLSRGTSKVDDILKYISGLNVLRGNGIYSLGASATLRGLSNEAARTLVLIDGIPINKSDTGEVNFNRINLRDIERIEIFKGPASTIYGNNAMGGVINIITKKPEKGIQGSADAFYGSNETIGGALELKGGLYDNGRGYYFGASGYYLDSSGYISTPVEKMNIYTVKRFAEESIGSFKIGYDFDKENSVGLKVDYFNDKRGEGLKILAPDGVSRDFDTWAYNLYYKGSYGNIKWQAKAFWQNENYRRVSERMAKTYTRFDVDSDRTDMGFDTSLSFPLLTSHLITIGGDIREGRVDASDIYLTSPDRADNKGKLRLHGIWVQDEITLLGDKLFILAGLRFDHAKFFDGSFYSTVKPFNKLSGDLAKNSWNAFSPKLSTKYKWTQDFSTYISFGTGFRASILDDLCRSGIMWGIYKIANPKIEPERIYNYEIGFDYGLTKQTQLKTSLYYSIGKDFLYYVPTGDSLDGKPLYMRENIEKVTSYGLEIDLRFKLARWLTQFINYTYTNSEIDKFSLKPYLEGAELTRTPRNQIKAGITLFNPVANFTVLSSYKSSQYFYTNEMTQTTQKIGGYTTVDMKLSKELFKGIHLSVSVDNLFDKRYLESADDLAPGRVITGLIKYDF